MLAIAFLGAMGGLGLGLKGKPGVILMVASIGQCLLFMLLSVGLAMGKDSWPGILFIVASVLSGVLPLRIKYTGPGKASVKWLAALPAMLVFLALVRLSSLEKIEPIIFLILGAPPCLLAAAVWSPYRESSPSESKSIG